MTTETNLDRNLFDISSKFAEPLCAAYGQLRYRLVMPLDPNKFDHYSTVAGELAYRSLIVGVASLGAYLAYTMPLPVLCALGFVGAAHKVFRALGCYFQKNGYTHVKGQAAEKQVGTELKVMTWNILGIPGGMHYNHGGAIGWQGRIDRIVAKIKTEDPDVLVLQEIFDTALGEELVKRLGADYAHFYTHIGPNLWGSEGGVMVITKCAVDKFSYHSFSNNDWTMNRGFAILDLKGVRIIGTHFIAGNAQSKRNAQMEQIKQTVRFQRIVPTVIAGDLNTERDTYWDGLLVHGYKEEEATCTNLLTRQWNPAQEDVNEETIDYISLFEGSEAYLEEGRLIRAFDATHNTKTALSDHHGIALTVKGLNLV
jgi:endonuclease/exonuclease/phosphatase family metal-dependent hydrolase